MNPSQPRWEFEQEAALCAMQDWLIRAMGLGADEDDVRSYIEQAIDVARSEAQDA